MVDDAVAEAIEIALEIVGSPIGKRPAVPAVATPAAMNVPVCTRQLVCMCARISVIAHDGVRESRQVPLQRRRRGRRTGAHLRMPGRVGIPRDLGNLTDALGAGTPVVPGKLSGRPLTERTAR